MQKTATTPALTTAETAALDRDGYIVLPGVIDPQWLEQLREAFEKAVAHEGPTKDARQTGTRHVANVEWGKDPAFEQVLAEPNVAAAAHHILKRPFKVHLAGRDPLPGFGQQGLHQDWYFRAPSEPFAVVTTIWLLDDFTPTNGPTRLVPGSHLFPRPLPKSMQDPANRHPDQKFIQARAGSVLVFNGHVYHSGTRNTSGQSRRVLQCQFLASEFVRSGGDQRELP